MSYFKREAGAPQEPHTDTMPVPAIDGREDPFPDGPYEPYPDSLPEQETEFFDRPEPTGSRIGGFRGRVTRALTNFDRGKIASHIFEPREAREPGEPGEPSATERSGPAIASPREASSPRWSADLPEPSDPHAVIDEVPPRSDDAHFPIGPLGYNRTAVDERIAELERELGELRGQNPPVSITEEIDRLGEQTASILVVAHDQAHETTRAAQEQADRCIADAAANAVAITENARRELHELDSETDAVWRERARLLEDAREVGLALIAISEEALERFPAEVRTPEPS